HLSDSGPLPRSRPWAPHACGIPMIGISLESNSMPVRISRLSLAMGSSIALLGSGALAQSADAPAQPQEEIVVTAKKLDTARDLISPSLGASDYFIDSKAIQNTPQGVNAGFNQVLLQAPGVSQDSYGQLHIRN